MACPGLARLDLGKARLGAILARLEPVCPAADGAFDLPEN